MSRLTQRARFPADSMPQNDKLISRKRMCCHEPPCGRKHLRSERCRTKSRREQASEGKDEQQRRLGNTQNKTRKNPQASRWTSITTTMTQTPPKPFCCLREAEIQCRPYEIGLKWHGETDLDRAGNASPACSTKPHRVSPSTLKTSLVGQMAGVGGRWWI